MNPHDVLTKCWDCTSILSSTRKALFAITAKETTKNRKLHSHSFPLSCRPDGRKSYNQYRSKDCFQHHFYGYAKSLAEHPQRLEPRSSPQLLVTARCDWSRHAVTDTAMPVNLKKERLARVANWNRPSRIYFMTQESLAFVHIFYINNMNCIYLVSQRSGT